MASPTSSVDLRDKFYKSTTGESDPKRSVYFNCNILKQFGVLISNTEQQINEHQVFFTGDSLITESIETLAETPLEKVRRVAETIAKDVIPTFGNEDAKKPPNKYCKTLRRTVKELSSRHELVFKGIVKKLNPDEENAIQTFVTVADELFAEGQVNWGRIVAVYAFAAHLAKHLTVTQDIETGETQTVGTENKTELKLKEIIAEFVGKYVSNKLGHWIVDHGGWDAFVEYFPDQTEFEAKLWKYGMITTLGLGALATIFATR